MYLLYLKRTFKYRRKRHLILFLTLMLALLMPFIVSIYKSSMDFGAWQSAKFITKGADFHVWNAKEEYLSLFNQIDGAEAFYDDGVIYIKRKAVNDEGQLSPDEQADKRLEALQELEKKVVDLSIKIGDERLRLRGYSNLMSDETVRSFSEHIVKFDIGITVVSILIAFFAYRSHINLFRSDIGIMVSMGARCRQIVSLFLLEFAVLLSLAAAVALVASMGIMKLISDVFFIKNVEKHLWIEFCVDVKYSLIHVLPFLLAGFAVIAVSVKLMLRKSAADIMQDKYILRVNKRHCIGLNKKADVSKLLSSLFIRRTNRTPLICSIVIIPVVIVIIVSMSCIVPSINNDSPEISVVVKTYDFDNARSYLTNEDVALIKAMDEIKGITVERNFYSTEYLIKDKRMGGTGVYHLFGEDDDDSYAKTFIYKYSEIFPSSKLSLKRDEVVVTPSHEYLSYKIGDVIPLMPNPFDLVTHEYKPKEPIMLTVAGFSNDVISEEMVALYLSDELYQEFIKDKPMGDINIELKNPAEHAGVIAKLKGMFPMLKGNILDLQYEHEVCGSEAKGEILMYVCLFSTMLVLLLFILAMRIYAHMNEQRSVAQTLSIIGADKRTIFKGYLRQMRINFALVMLVSFSLAYILLEILLYRTGISAKFDVAAIAVQLGILISVYLAYCLPVRWAFDKNGNEKI